MLTIHLKDKLLARILRLRGQVEGMERALESDSGCETVFHLIAGVPAIVADTQTVSTDVAARPFS